MPTSDHAISQLILQDKTFRLLPSNELFWMEVH